MNPLGEAIGELCKIILPIDEEYYYGDNGSSVAVCTLSSLDLLKKFANSPLMEEISIVGRLLSENKGIDSIVDYLSTNLNVSTLIVCGKEVWGHKAGHSLFQLYHNGVDKNNRIINSQSPDPYLTVSRTKISFFQENVTLVNLINETDFDIITKKIRNS